MKTGIYVRISTELQSYEQQIEPCINYCKLKNWEYQIFKEIGSSVKHRPVFEELSGEYDGKLKFAKLDTQTDPELAQEYQVQGIPCLIIMKGEKEVDRIVGFSPKDELKSQIDEILEKV